MNELKQWWDDMTDAIGKWLGDIFIHDAENYNTKDVVDAGINELQKNLKEETDKFNKEQEK
jgi:hypothetical protein